MKVLFLHGWHSVPGKDWLLREGFRNSIMYEYLAATCARAGGLLAALSEERVDRELLTAAGEIIQALIVGGPAEGIDDYEDARPVIESYLGHMESSAETVKDFLHVNSVKVYLEEDDSRWAGRYDAGWTSECREALRSECAAILGRPEWVGRVRANLGSRDDLAFAHADRQRRSAERAAEGERRAREREAEQRAGVVAARAALRRTLTRQMADRLQADMMRLAEVGGALATTVKQGHRWNERQFIDWMTPALEREPEILGLCIAFEPGKFDPMPDPATVREPFRPLLPLCIDALDPFRDGYSLYVRRDHRPGSASVAEALKREYRYRTQPWYANTLKGRFRGWEEPTPDLHGPMVAYTLPLYRPGDHDPIGALCVDLSVAYFDRLDA